MSTYCGAGVKAFVTALNPLFAVSTTALPTPLAASTIELPAPLAASMIPLITPERSALSLLPNIELSPRAAPALIAAAISAVVAGCEPAIVKPPESSAFNFLANSIAACFFFSSSVNGVTVPSVA